MGFHRKSDSFTFSKTFFQRSTNAKQRKCRTRLQDRFGSGEAPCSDSSEADRGIWSGFLLSSTRRALRSGSGRLSKTFTELRTAIGNFSQRFRVPTKRRQILEDGPVTPGCATPQTFSRAVLGRTPTKLYSPFSINSNCE